MRFVKSNRYATIGTQFTVTSSRHLNQGCLLPDWNESQGLPEGLSPEPASQHVTESTLSDPLETLAPAHAQQCHCKADLLHRV